MIDRLQSRENTRDTWQVRVRQRYAIDFKPRYDPLGIERHEDALVLAFARENRHRSHQIRTSQTLGSRFLHCGKRTNLDRQILRAEFLISGFEVAPCESECCRNDRDRKSVV